MKLGCMISCLEIHLILYEYIDYSVYIIMLQMLRLAATLLDSCNLLLSSPRTINKGRKNNDVESELLAYLNG